LLRLSKKAFEAKRGRTAGERQLVSGDWYKLLENIICLHLKMRGYHVIVGTEGKKKQLILLYR
jgi:hypothetical protein